MLFLFNKIIYLSNILLIPMGEYRIQVIGHTQISSWVNLLNENRFDKLAELPRTLNIDLTHMYFIAPYHVVSLACLIEEYYMKGVIIRFNKVNNQASRYLDNLGFFNYWEDGFDRKKYHPEEVKTSFCLWQLDKEMFHPYVTYAQAYFTKHFFNGLDLQPLNTSLTELFNNVIDHSKSKVSGYVFTQYYPNKKEFIISLCDFGSGIPNTIIKYLRKTQDKTVTPLEAFDLAFKRGFSTESTPSNRGLGLDNIASIVRSMKSELLIISNNVCFKQQSDGKIVKQTIQEGFRGTQVVIYLKTDNLKPLVVEELVEDEFNF